MFLKYILLLTALSCLGGCAVNNVSDVDSKFDTLSFYRVPVVYGISTDDETSKFIGRNGSINFVEYDPKTASGASSCLGSANEINVGKEIASGANKDQMSYHVIMVPPGYYAKSRGIELYNVGSPVYFEVESGVTQYLGDFRVKKMMKDQGLSDDKEYFIDLVEYHEDRALAALKKFGVTTEKVKKIDLIPATGFVGGVMMCMP